MKINENKYKIAEVIGNKKYKEGTLRVKIAYSKKHSKYKKIQNCFTYLQVQYDPKEPIEIGTQVYISSCRPISKTKTWKVLKVEEQC